MPPKKKGAEEVDDLTKKARFGRVRNNLKMGLVGSPTPVSILADAVLLTPVSAPLCLNMLGRSSQRRKEVTIPAWPSAYIP